MSLKVKNGLHLETQALGCSNQFSFNVETMFGVAARHFAVVE